MKCDHVTVSSRVEILKGPIAFVTPQAAQYKVKVSNGWSVQSTKQLFAQGSESEASIEEVTPTEQVTFSEFP